MQARNGAEPILEVRNLKTHFFTDKGVVKAVKGVSFSLANKQTLGIVGESGCGKSVTAHSIMQLIKSPPVRLSRARSSSAGRSAAPKRLISCSLTPKAWKCAAFVVARYP